MTPEQQCIFDLIPAGASVLDVGCGDGTMLNLLVQSKNVTPLGLEIDIERIKQCVTQKVPVLQMNIDNGLSGFKDQQFDVAILKFTISEVNNPSEVLREIMRVSKEAIVVISNFAYWSVRWSLLTRGKMPVTAELPYQWHDTPNIHLLSIQDLEDFFAQEGTRILERTYFAPKAWERALIELGLQNIAANTALYHLRRS
jgi:methionine biosynthesis protein MetW